MKQVKQRKCDNCKKLFTPRNSFHVYCDTNCALIGMKDKKPKVIKLLAKADRMATRQKKMERMNHGDWICKLQPLINQIARLIDFGQPCMSCNGKGKPQAGHYHTTAAHGSIRFNLHNIHIQDYHCNVELSSNITGYNKGLIEIYGKEYQEYVEYVMVKDYPCVKLTIDEIKETIVIAKELIKQLQNETGWNEVERLQLRDNLNEKLGIYKIPYFGHFYPKTIQCT